MRRVRIHPLEGSAPARILEVGSTRLRMPCRLDPKRGELALPAGLLTASGAVPGQEVHLHELPGGGLRFGPVVGVLLGPKDMANLRDNPRYELMSRAARIAGVIPCFFDAEGLNPRTGGVTGWHLRDDGWRIGSLPIPEVIYNRATHPRREDRQAASATIRRLLRTHPTTLINTANAFSKSQVVEALRFFKETAGLAPETVPFRKAEDLLQMLDRFPQVYVKADHGSHGDSVVRVRPEGDGCRVKGKIQGHVVDELFGSCSETAAFMIMCRGEEQWVLQQGIALPRVAERIFDLRAVVQKNGTGDWEVALLIVRHAQPGGVAANMSQGAEPYRPEDFLKRCGSQLPDLGDLTSTAAAAAIRTALALESRFGRLGEVGVDIGIDLEGRPWIFEANTKPLHPLLPGQDPLLLLRRPFVYAAYLASRAWVGTESGLALPV